MIPLFKSLIWPAVEYATPVWCPYLQKDIAELESVQRKFTKFISGLRDFTYAHRLEELKLPNPAVRRDYFDLLECFKLVHGLVRSDCSDSFTISHNCTRGHNYKLQTTQRTPRLNVRAHFLTERVMRLWNALPAEIAELADYNRFKAALKRHLNV